MSQFRENLWTHRRMDGQALFYRTFPTQARGQKDTEKIFIKDNVEKKSKLNTKEIKLKQKEHKEKDSKNELNEIKKEIDKIKRENLQQTKNSNIQKENNIKIIKQLEEEKDTLQILPSHCFCLDLKIASSSFFNIKIHFVCIEPVYQIF